MPPKIKIEVTKTKITNRNRNWTGFKWVEGLLRVVELLEDKIKYSDQHE